MARIGSYGGMSGGMVLLDGMTAEFYGSSGPPLSPIDWWDPDLGAFQNTAGSTPATATSDPVARLNGQTGTIGNLTNSGGTDRPLLTVNGVNAHSYLTFDGSNDFLSKVATIAKPCTVVLAMYAITWGTNAEIFGNTSASRGRVIMSPSTPSFRLQVADVITSGINQPALTTWSIMSVRFGQMGSDDTYRVNNNARNTLAAGGNTDYGANFEGMSFAKAFNLTPSNIRMGRAAIYSTQLSQTDEDTVVAAFMSYYGI